jgi:hypothetical protein
MSDQAPDPGVILSRIQAAHDTGDDSNDLKVLDYDLLERRYKHDGWRDQNQMDFELGWEAAIIHLRKLLRG